MKSIFLAVALSFAVSSVSVQAQKGNNDAERIEIPGGLSDSTRSTMWLAAKTKCYDLGYSDIREDKEVGVLTCQNGHLSQIMRFSTDAVTLTSPTTGFSNVPIIGGIWSKPRKDRLRLRNAMEKAVGLPETER